MTEYIMEVSDKTADAFIATFGIEGVLVAGERLTGKIVRCRDCEHHDHGRCWADQWSTASLMPAHRVNPDSFCSYGERRHE